MARKSSRGKEYPALVEVAGDGRSVRVADVTIPREATPRGGAPSWSEIRDLVLDQPTAETLRFLARGLICDANVLLVGETATSKSAGVQFLAALTGNPLLRISLNGQTDTGELVGRFMPNPDPGIRRADLEKHRQTLQPASREILDQAVADKRELEMVDRLRIAAVEGWPPGVEQPWVFREGLVVEALRCGAWVLLDEVNLAETAVLERLNSVLDHPRSLVLTEHDGTRFGLTGGVPIEPRFRMLATMNPAEYEGRSRLSQAFLNRWTLVRAVRLPTEADYRALVRGFVLQEIPVVEVAGQCWRGVVDAPSGLGPSRSGYDDLRRLKGVEAALDGLAVFHTKMVTLCSDGGSGAAIGGTRRQPYSYTRRDLITCLDMMDDLAGQAADVQDVLREAIECVYRQRILDEVDRERVRDVIAVLALGTASNGPGGQTPPIATLCPSATWQSWSGQLAAGASAGFLLELKAGWSIELTTSPPEGAAESDTVLELRHRDLGLVARDDDGGVGLSSSLTHRVADGGTHEVRLRHLGGAAGAYRLAYRCSQGGATDRIEPVDNWRTVSGELPRPTRASPNPCRDYSFEAAVGDRYDFSTSPSTGNGLATFDSTLEVLDPDGSRLAFNDDGGDGRTSVVRSATAAHAGTHVVRVAAYKASPGDFRLAYRRSPADGPTDSRSSGGTLDASRFSRPLISGIEARAVLEPIADWRSEAGKLTAAAPVARYDFEGRTGTRLAFSTSASDGGAHADFDTVIDLYDPDGVLVASDDDGGEGLTSVLRTVLAASGRHAVIVRDFDIDPDDEEEDDDDDGEIASLFSLDPDEPGAETRSFRLAYRIET